ncbi:AgmX/PglI C-terminal domain-containing protein [Pyxidicoccus sp. 3LG]
MGEFLSGAEGQGMGTPGAAGVPGVARVPGVPLSVSDALDADLDAYLDRELFVGPRLDSASEAHEPEAVATASGSMRALLDMAEAEAEWLETQPPSVLSRPEAPPEPDEPPVTIPEWMRVAPGAKETARFADMLSPADPDAVRPPTGEDTDASGLPATPWSVPAQPVPPPGFASAPVFPGHLLPGLAPPPGMAMQGAPVHPWGPSHAYVPQQPWGMHPVAHAEPKRLAGMRPGAFLGAATAGVLAAGLLVVAGLHFREDIFGTRDATVAATQVPGQGTPVGTGVFTSVQGAHPGGGTSSGTDSVAQVGAIPGMSGAAQPSGLQGHPGASGTGATGMSEPSAAQQAAASVAGTVMSTAQGDLQGAASGLRAPTLEPTNSAPVGATTLASGKVVAVANRDASARKAPAKTGGTAKARAAADTDEESAPASGELSFDESESGGTNVPSESEDSETSPGAKVAVSSTDARPPDAYSDLDEDFARELGFTEDSENKEAADPRASRTVYIPPAPDAKQQLTPDDVKQVVVANQPAITACIRQHAKGTPVEGGGRFLVQWSVLPSGDTTSVSMSTDTLRATPLARCIEDVVRRWKFPAHQVRMQEPIRFPFVF